MTSEYVIDRALATKVLEVVDAGLVYGMGDPVPGHMCVEAAVSFAMGLPHGDEPPCVASNVRSFKIELNDQQWSSPQARAQGMRRVAIAQLGTRSIPAFEEDVDNNFAKEVKKEVARTVASRTQAALTKQVEALQETVTDLASFIKGSEIDLNIFDEKMVEVQAAFHAINRSKRRLWQSENEVRIFDGEDNDEDLAHVAECAVQVLIRMGSPGAEFLDLAPL